MCRRVWDRCIAQICNFSSSSSWSQLFSFSRRFALFSFLHRRFVFVKYLNLLHTLLGCSTCKLIIYRALARGGVASSWCVALDARGRRSSLLLRRKQTRTSERCCGRRINRHERQSILRSKDRCSVYLPTMPTTRYGYTLRFIYENCLALAYALRIIFPAYFVYNSELIFSQSSPPKNQF